MNLEGLILELRQCLREPTVESGFTGWLNDAIQELAMQMELPKLKLKTPAILITVNTEWQYSLTTDVSHDQGFEYLKKVFRVTNPSDDDRELPIARTIEAIDRIDPDHDETDDEITKIGVEDDTLGVFPMAADTLNLWFFRKPVAMVNDTDEPDGIDPQYHYSVLIPKVVLRAFRLYPDLGQELAGDNTRTLQLWTQRLHAGLWGDSTMIGMVQALGKNRPSRLRGARPGKNLSGGDTYNWSW